jgi:hypothetical protein
MYHHRKKKGGRKKVGNVQIPDCPGSELTALCKILRTALAASTTRPFNSKFSSLSTARVFSASSSAPSTTPTPFLLPPPALTFPSTNTGAFAGDPDSRKYHPARKTRNPKLRIGKLRPPLTHSLDLLLALLNLSDVRHTQSLHCSPCPLQIAHRLFMRRFGLRLRAIRNPVSFNIIGDA